MQLGLSHHAGQLDISMLPYPAALLTEMPEKLVQLSYKIGTRLYITALFSIAQTKDHPNVCHQQNGQISQAIVF